MTSGTGEPPLKIMVITGARPNFMKAAPVLSEIAKAGHEALLVHTGQHYDVQLSDSILHDLRMGEPDFHLNVGSASHAQQTARIMQAFEPVFLDVRPHWLVVVGDVNSTLACALVAVKLKEETGCGIAHVEAGLRSHDWRMPEEVNRVLTDRISDVLFTPSEDAAENLKREGIPAERVVFAGNVMVDSLLAQLDEARAADVATRLGVRHGGYVVTTLHRPSNVDRPETLRTVLLALVTVQQRIPVVIPLHPRTRERCERFGLEDLLRQLNVCPPLGYVDMLSLVDGAAAVLTDSGGLQEETTVLGIPCVTLREQTERPVTITHGTNRMSPWPLSVDGIVQVAMDACAKGRQSVPVRCPAGWDGMAAARIVARLGSPHDPYPTR